MIFTRSLNPKSSSPFTSHSVTLPSAPITSGLKVTSMFHSFWFSGKFYVLIYRFIFLQFSPVVSGNSKIPSSTGSCVLLTITRSGHPVKIRWSVCILRSQRNLFVSFSRWDFGLCIYHFYIWLNLNSLHNSMWITLHGLAAFAYHVVDRFVSVII